MKGTKIPWNLSKIPTRERVHIFKYLIGKGVDDLSKFPAKTIQFAGYDADGFYISTVREPKGGIPMTVEEVVYFISTRVWVLHTPHKELTDLQAQFIGNQLLCGEMKQYLTISDIADLHRIIRMKIYDYDDQIKLNEYRQIWVSSVK